jgi:hypothetical protein
VIPIQQVLPGALAAVLRKAPLTKEKVEFAWRTAVGPALAKVTTVEWRGTGLQSDTDLQHGRLRVMARDANWQREVNRARPVILARLRDILGDAVDGLDVSAPTAGESGSARRRR